MLTLLTATGARPAAWAICQKLMLRQTYAGPVGWIIVDDGEVPQEVTFKRENWALTVVRPEPFWEKGQNTQARNLKAGLDLVEPDGKVVIIEDDDAYHPQWLDRVDDWLCTSDLVGEAPARYYNIKSNMARLLQNRQHASLCCTAMKGNALLTFAKELKPGVQFIDLGLWKNFNGRKALYPTEMVIGIKGMPGRMGIGMGHRQDFMGRIDRDKQIFHQWLGPNSDLYE